jgi:hypothetical protein
MRSVPDIITAEGFELFQRGLRWRGLCPLHDRDGRNPSFSAWETGWKCWSCGESGDGPAFIMKLKGMSFPQALAYLGEERVRLTQNEKAKLAAERKERTAARWAESNLAWTLGTLIRRCHEALRDISPGNIDDHALILRELETLNYQHDLLIYGDKTVRAELVRELADFSRYSRRGLLFREDFDFAAWARGIDRYQEPRDGTKPKPEPRFSVTNRDRHP